MRRPLEISLAAVNFFTSVVLLVVWARSYSYADLVQGNMLGHVLGVISINNRLKLTMAPQPNWTGIDLSLRTFETDQNQAAALARHISRFANSRGFGVQYMGENVAILVPHWFLVLFCALAGTIAGVRRLRRFSVRSFLIASASLAVLLWIIVAPD